MLYLVYAFIDSPKEKLLKRKYEEVLTQYSLLSNKVEHLDNVLKDMESRDDNIYRVISKPTQSHHPFAGQVPGESTSTNIWDKSTTQIW